MKAETKEFLKNNFIKEGEHVRSDIPGVSKGYIKIEHLLEEYAQSQLPKETKPSILGQEHIDPNEVHSSGIQTSETDISKEEDLLDDVTNILHHNHNEGWIEDRETARKILKRIFISPKEGEEVYVECKAEEAEYTLIRPSMPLHCEGYVKRITLSLPTEEECKWTYDENYDYYDTGCGGAYCLIDGTLKENNHLYCPYCGKKIALKEKRL